MISIGILLPGSTLYPSIGIDFLQGIRSCFNYHEITDLHLQVNPIGYGLNEDEIYKEAEKFLLSYNADVVVLYASDQVAQRLSPLFAATGKLLLITNVGANYPLSSADVSSTIFHSLNDNICCFLTGNLCAAENGKNAIMATSFYDGGYQHSHAMSNAFSVEGGEIKFNFVSHFKKEEFNTEALDGFIKDNPDTGKLMAVFSGDVARCFYKKMEPLQKEVSLQLYGSPMMFDCTPGDFAETKPYVKNIKGYTSWVPELDNSLNSEFKIFYQKENGKEVNIFSMQGWEIALLIKEYLQQRKNTANVGAAIAQLKEVPLTSPRGVIKISENNLVTGSAHLVSASGRLEIKIEDVLEDTSLALKEMIAQIPDTEFSSWRNTYLCI